MPKDATSPAPAPQSASSRVPILVVEDDDSIREVLLLFFEDEGFFPVAEAATMAEAAAYLPTVQLPHVVLLDFRNPSGDADILLRLVERDAALQRHRYILIPASPITRFSEEAQRLITAICTKIVYKPFDVENLLTAVERAEAHLLAGADD